MVADPTIVLSAMQEGAYLLTSGWLMDWQKQIESWGFDKNTIKEFFSESISSLVLLDTGISADSHIKLNKFASYTGMPSRIIPVGTGYFSLFLKQFILNWQLNQKVNHKSDSEEHTISTAANYAMAMELLVGLTKIWNEDKVIEAILEIFSMLFAPKQVEYIPWNENRPGKIVVLSADYFSDEQLETWLNVSNDDETWQETDGGFLLRIRYIDKTVGGLAVKSIAFPEYRNQYLNLAIEVAHLCGLAIINARTYQEIQRFNAELENRVQERTSELVVKNQQLRAESQERQRAVEALQESESRYHAVVSSLTEGIIQINTDGMILTYNTSVMQILGLSRMKIAGSTLQKLALDTIHEDGSVFPIEEHPMLMSLKTGLPCLGEIMGLRKADGELTWLLINSQPMFHQDDLLPYGVVGSFSDISNRKRSDEQIRKKVEQLSTLRTIDQAILASQDIDRVLDTILKETLDRLEIDAADILRLTPETSELKYVAGRGFYSHDIELTHVLIGEGYAGQAANEQRVVHVDHLNKFPVKFTRPELIKNENFSSYYAVPLQAKGRLVGLLEVFQRTKTYHDLEWINYLEILAGQAAIAVDNWDLFSNLQTTNLELNQAYETTLEGWSHALDLRDKETEGHTQRVTTMTEQLARYMGMNENALVDIRRGALLHDIGKMGVPEHILLKPDKLTEDEWKIMKTHPKMAYDLLSPIAYLKGALDIPYCHHEKWDGTGYPRGLKREEIPLAARIFAVIDVYDALTSDRPYRAAWSKEMTIDYLNNLSGSHFEPRVVISFLEVLRNNNFED
ncbi:MAG: HD domain-containing protein [Anaerolineae bacterium]|nr:HD domain-containing protein [Anaerolineae bacterium]